MDLIYTFLKTILNFLIQILSLFVQLIVYVLNFGLDLLRFIANAA